MHRLILLVAVIFLGLNGNAQKVIQPESVVNFEIGGIGWSTVEGTIKGMTGTVQLNDGITGSAFNVCIQPTTVFTDNDERDEHLKNEDFFNVPKFPKICFVSTSVLKKEGKFVAQGAMTMLGVTKQVSIPFSVVKKEGKTVLTGDLEIDRFDYGLAKESYSSTIMVDDEVKIEIICVVQ